VTSNAAIGVRGRHAVPFFDLQPSHEPLRDEILASVREIVDSGGFINGPAVAAFEGAFADYCGTSACVGVASGLDALRLALLALGVGVGDEVVVPANTFIATFEAVSQVGATPVPVDCSFADYNIDVAAMEAAVGGSTAALLPVHLYGQMADMRRVTQIAESQGLAILEDACQAHGAERDGLRAGSVGAAAAFSFYPAKNLGAFGDAGALVTNDARLASAACELREHGQREKYHHVTTGYTARLDTIQAAVLLHKLPVLDTWNQQRTDAVAYYCEALEGVGDLQLPPVAATSSPVWHLFVIRTARPSELADHLGREGVGTGRHYPQPPHLSEAYRALGHAEGAFPFTEQLAREALSLPLFPGISEEQLGVVVSAVRGFFDNRA
jgi:dTDP-4-amino-4,6-dideoxygalactose transaminase